MLVTNVKDDDIVNYKKVSMFIGMPYCTGKCWKELGLDCSICQNNKLQTAKLVDISIDDLIKRFDSSILSNSIVFGGLEPLDSYNDLIAFIKEFRKEHDDDIVIYTGYKEEEIEDKIKELSKYKDIIIKVGRYIPNRKERYDPILSVILASDNQYAIHLMKKNKIRRMIENGK